MRDMTKIIENIVTKEPNPDPKYAPHIVLRWYTKTEGQIYHDLSTRLLGWRRRMLGNRT